MSRIYLFALAIGSFLLAGCLQSVYVLELTPEDAGVLPADISGYGRWVRYESPLGDVIGYSERFRGSDDLQRIGMSRWTG